MPKASKIFHQSGVISKGWYYGGLYIFIYVLEHYQKQDLLIEVNCAIRRISQTAYWLKLVRILR